MTSKSIYNPNLSPERLAFLLKEQKKRREPEIKEANLRDMKAKRIIQPLLQNRSREQLINLPKNEKEELLQKMIDAYK